MGEVVKLVTFLGLGKYEESEIKINGNLLDGCVKNDGSQDIFCVRQSIFPLALIEYLNHIGKQVETIFFLTKTVKESKTWDECRRFLRSNIKDFEIPGGESSSNLMNFLVRNLVENLEKGDRVILDVTHSFRSIPLMASVVALYLKEAKDVNVSVVYGKYNKETKVTECEDLTPLTKATSWIYAVRLFKEYGYAKELADLIKKRNEEIYRGSQSSKKPKLLGSMSQKLQDLSSSIRLGSIVAIRKNLTNFFNFIDRNKARIREETEVFVPEIAALLDGIEKRYRVIHVKSENFELSEKELESEKELLDFYLQTGDLGMALRLAREYLINVYLMSGGEKSDFLDRNVRESVSISTFGYDTILQARNHVAHFGFNKLQLPSLKKIEDHLKVLVQTPPEQLLESARKTQRNRKRALLTPLGTTKGALYTVLKKISPDLLLVITSKQGKAILSEILEKAEFKGEFRVILLENPFMGVSEIDRVVSEIKEHLSDVDEVIVNLTGGTTFLTYVIERAKNQIRYGRKVKTILAVDKRTYEEQKQNPFVVGEILELD